MDMTRAIILKCNIIDNLYKKQPTKKNFQVSQPSSDTLSKTGQPQTSLNTQFYGICTSTQRRLLNKMRKMGITSIEKNISGLQQIHNLQSLC